jgi:Flp pilus assembly protein TadG
MGNAFHRIRIATGLASKAWRNWRSHVHGGIAISFAMSLPALLGIAGLASDYAMMVKLRGDLQAAADAAAIAGAREIPLAMSKAEQVASAVKSFAAYQLTQDSEATASELAARNIALSVEVIDDFSAVKVNIKETWTPFFAHFIAAGITPIEASATAKYVGSTNICVLGLSPSVVAGVQLWDSAQLTANDCAVYSNTNSITGFNVLGSAVIKSSLNCVVGGFETDTALSVTPSVVTDCPALDDPLKDRPAPKFGACDHTAMKIASATKVLSPGVYCGGLMISGTSKVTLSPGIYVIKGGPLVVRDTAKLSAENAGFYLTGLSSVVWFTSGTTISLSAPVDGPMAGLLFFEDRNATGVRLHRLASNNARTLLGTIYLSKSILNIDATAPVGDQSAYTAIVTQSLQLQSGPNLTLNSDYSATNVPVPTGIAGSSQVILTK